VKKIETMEEAAPVAVRKSGKGIAAAVAAALALMSTGGAQAIEVPSDNPDIRMRWDNSFRYSAGVRVESQDKAIINHPLHSSGDLKFERGDMISNRLDILSEFDFVYKEKSGFRVSAAGWYDNAYDDKVHHIPGVVSPYFNDRYSNHTKRFTRGPSAEFLDAFVFTQVQLGEVPVNIRFGQYSEYWGETLFAPYMGVNYAQAPLDIYKALASPGSEVKELFIPTRKISFQASLLPELSIAGYKSLEYELDRIPDGGTYFGDTDLIYNGVQRAQLAPGFVVVKGSDIKGNDRKAWGMNLRWTPKWLDGTLGFYYRKFDEKLPWGVQFDFANALYRLAYAKNTELYGLSLAKGIMGVSVGMDLAYRKDTALLSAGNDINSDSGARGDVLFGVVNGIWYFGKNPLWSQAVFIAEANWTHLDKITKDPQLANLAGSAACPAGKWGGCTHKNALGLNLQFTPSWDQALPSVDVSMPMSFGIGLRNNGVTPGSTNQGQGSWSVGVSATVSNQWIFTLKYIDYLIRYREEGGVKTIHNGQGDSLLPDRGWVSFTAKTTF
jgi:hypothetical protein